MNMKCNFEKCESETKENYRFCESHTGLYCIGCGFPATKTCDHSNTCDEEVCNKCKHSRTHKKVKPNVVTSHASPYFLIRPTESLEKITYNYNHVYYNQGDREQI